MSNVLVFQTLSKIMTHLYIYALQSIKYCCIIGMGYYHVTIHRKAAIILREIELEMPFSKDIS